jgi:hypothetical protein
MILKRSRAGGHVLADSPKPAEERENFGVTVLELHIVKAAPLVALSVVSRSKWDSPCGCVVVRGNFFPNHGRGIGIGQRVFDSQK